MNRVDWDQTAWRIEVTVAVYELLDDGKQKRTETTLHLDHDFTKDRPLRREANTLAPGQSLTPFAQKSAAPRSAVSQDALTTEFRSAVRTNFRKKAHLG